MYANCQLHRTNQNARLLALLRFHDLVALLRKCDFHAALWQLLRLRLPRRELALPTLEVGVTRVSSTATAAETPLHRG